ncbi:type I-E CRISPR-associated protein Cas6/Cse3/CasE [Liquorilactobacillus capillatus]|uniref:CRISPR associated family protein n=1 Tax=Liquorilactobacillus capillatus DSM 19910 TaxID=1423731 RepID=A0A0R1M6U0_9LACO|nr:type I-E CRISPR-associated protein Cas6/Cse3/CasE [Liquorilactobacillus capillatus]KRL00522.1 CRISPR associated family protein [Liquorilactobacillus capillatus DSM 19910]
MYLARVEIATKNRQKIKDLTHLGAYHNWVEQSFPDEINLSERKRHLWRLDQLAGKNYLLVLSENRPDEEYLKKYGVSGTVKVKPYNQFLDAIRNGEVMQFRLTANPSYSVLQPGKKRGRVYPHVTVKQQRQWLKEKAKKAGFKLVQQRLLDSKDDDGLAFDIVSRDHPVLYREKGRAMRLSRVTFEGLLQVQDVTVFKETLTKGLGREKAFGMGLMTVITEV